MAYIYPIGSDHTESDKRSVPGRDDGGTGQPGSRDSSNDDDQAPGLCHPGCTPRRQQPAQADQEGIHRSATA